MSDVIDMRHHKGPVTLDVIWQAQQQTFVRDGAYTEQVLLRPDQTRDLIRELGAEHDWSDDRDLDGARFFGIEIAVR